MNKFFLAVLLITPIFAEDKTPPQPTAEERLVIMQAQRDFLQTVAQTQKAEQIQQDAGIKLDQKASELATKYHCKPNSWKPDFTCIVETPKTEEKPKTTSKLKFWHKDKEADGLYYNVNYIK